MGPVVRQVRQRLEVLLAVIAGVEGLILHVVIVLISLLLAGHAVPVLQRPAGLLLALGLSVQASCQGENTVP